MNKIDRSATLPPAVGAQVERGVRRLCRDDNWTQVLDDPAPRAVRWALREVLRKFSPDWTKWHYTEGNGSFTACGEVVVPFRVDGSPQESELRDINCGRCLSRMKTPNGRSELPPA